MQKVKLATKAHLLLGLLYTFCVFCRRYVGLRYKIYTDIRWWRRL